MKTIKTSVSVLLCALLALTVFAAGTGVSSAAHTHAWDSGTVTVKPTCQTPGTVLFRCTVKSCGATMEKELPPDPDAHVFKVTVTEPTCTEGGYTTHACTLCRYGYSDEETDPLGHAYGIRITPATCTSGGITTYTCVRCRDSFTKDPVPPVGHVDNDGDGMCDFGCGTVMTEQPDGGTCPLCGKTHTGPFASVIALFHRVLYFFRNLFGR